MSRRYTDSYRGWDSVATPEYNPFWHDGNLEEDKLPQDYIESLCDQLDVVSDVPDCPSDIFPCP